MEHKPFHQYNLDTGLEFWFDKGNKTSPSSGVLANYLLDEVPFKNVINNLTEIELLKDMASKRFDKVGQLFNKQNSCFTFFYTGNCNPQSLL